MDKSRRSATTQNNLPLSYYKWSSTSTKGNQEVSLGRRTWKFWNFTMQSKVWNYTKMSNSNYASIKAKDAICDAMHDRSLFLTKTSYKRRC